MKTTTLWSVLLLAILAPATLLAASMGDYCSAPPYVTRSVAPNIMVLMDNSRDMMRPAYPENTYAPNATNDNYKGYFEPQACYQYSNRFEKGTRNADGSCPATAPFRGNLLNWATTSKYDLLQKVLIGGNTVSKQGNSHTLLGIGGDWRATEAVRSYNSCIFEYNNGNLSITESAPGACSLLNPVAGFAELNPIRVFGEMFARGLRLSFEALAGELAGMGQVLLAAWDGVDLVSRAWASTLTAITVTGAGNAEVGTAYSVTFEVGGDNNDDYDWAVTDQPAWLTGTAYATVGNKKDCRLILSGTPRSEDADLVPPEFTFTVRATHRDGSDFRELTFKINVAREPLRIITEALSPAYRDTYYEFTMTALGGVKFSDAHLPDNEPHYHWSAAGLPPGLAINAATGKIYGIPTANGTYNTVDITVNSTAQTKTVRLTLSVTSPALHVITDAVLPATQNEHYLSWLEAAGGSPPYSWSITGLPAGLVLYTYSDTTAYLWGTPTVAGSFPITVTVEDAAGVTASRSYTLVVQAAPGAALQIVTTSPLPDGVRGVIYFTDIIATGGSGLYTWSIAGAPAGMFFSEVLVNGKDVGRIQWTPTNTQDGDYSFTVTVKDDVSGTTVSQTYTLRILRFQVVRKVDYNVRVKLIEEPLTDLNGNGIWDRGETWDDTCTECNTDGFWEGKKGVFQTFWDANKPKARWGLTMYRNQAASTVIDVGACIPASPASSYYTTLQNATPANNSPLGSELYGAINYFQNTRNGSYEGCTNSPPLDNVQCRKNFILIITSGSSTAGTKFAQPTPPGNYPTECDAYTDPVVRNACYAYKYDMVGDLLNGKQNIYTYVINTMGTANNAILRQTAEVGGGVYYDATDANDLEAQLTKALTDILSQAASGTAVSVLTTSSRGIGSMMQAYFLPVRLEGDREVAWTGYAQNIWIDPKDNLREDSVNDFQLNLDQDKIVKLYFDSDSNQTMAQRFTTGEYENCNPTEAPEEFDEIVYTWEGGKKLALRSPSTRNIFTSTKVIHGATEKPFAPDTGFGGPEFKTTMDAGLLSALDWDATYSAADIVRYIRGECLETTGGGDDCTGTTNDTFRDRRVTVATGDPDGNVWKLGDVISSTPKVLTNTPVNTYHIDYGDSSYYTYVSGVGYKTRSAMAFVGANDGMLHAFRVGYLQDTGLPDTIEALIKNFKLPEEDLSNDEIGDEVWGYIPYNALPYLKYLANPNYPTCHLYYNDLSARLVDASIYGAPTAGRNAASWRTILIGGMRFGGGCDGGTPGPALAGTAGYSAFYAIDVTDAEHPVALWEFSDPDLGYATTFPSIVRTGPKSENGNWYVVVGSGSTTLPKSNLNSADIARTRPGYIYFLDLETGALIKKEALDHNAIVGDILTVDADKDYHSEKLYFGTTYNDGGGWKGKIVKVDIPNSALTAAWTPTKTTLFSDVFPFTASLDAAKDAEGNIWVFGGSGKYFSDNDEIYGLDQIILGMKDLDSPSPAYPWDRTSLADQTLARTSGTVTGTQEVCGFDGNAFSSQTVVTSIGNPTVTGNTTINLDKGWFVTLTNGERVITRPLAVGGLVDFLTYLPSGDVCSYGGNSYLYAFGYTSGLAPTNVAIRSALTTKNAAGQYATSGDVSIARGVLLGPGAPPTGEAIIIPPPKEGQEQLKKKIQIATGVIVEAENTPVLSVISKIVHWLKK